MNFSSLKKRSNIILRIHTLEASSPNSLTHELLSVFSWPYSSTQLSAAVVTSSTSSPVLESITWIARIIVYNGIVLLHEWKCNKVYVAFLSLVDIAEFNRSRDWLKQQVCRETLSFNWLVQTSVSEGTMFSNIFNCFETNSGNEIIKSLKLVYATISFNSYLLPEKSL